MTNAEKIREFNRFYLPHMNLLGNHYLGSEYPVTEARVFFEIYQKEGCNAAYITRQMNIDKSYLSRILRKHEKDGYIRRKQSPEDARSYELYLTEQGKSRAEAFIQRSNEEIESKLNPLNREEQKQLINALELAMQLLAKE